MKAKAGIFVIFLFALMVTGCGPKGIKITGKLTASPDAVYYNFAGGAGCGSDVVNFEFTWPREADYDNRFIPPASVNLVYLLSIPSASSIPYNSLKMQAGSSSDLYTASLNVDELASDFSFGGTMPELEYWVIATGDYHAHDFDPKDFDSKSTAILKGTIFETEHRILFISPCRPVTLTVEPGQFTLTPSLTPIPSDTPTPTMTPTKQPTKKPRCVPGPNVTCP